MMVRPEAGGVTASPGELAFSAIVGRRSRAQNVTLANNGTSSVSISEIEVVGGFMQQTNNCGSKLGAGTSCTIAVFFYPTSGGCYDHHCKGKLNIIDGSPPMGQSVILTGDIL
jgi:hypothetical protein